MKTVLLGGILSIMLGVAGLEYKQDIANWTVRNLGQVVTLTDGGNAIVSENRPNIFILSERARIEALKSKYPQGNIPRREDSKEYKALFAKGSPLIEAPTGEEE